MDTDKELKTALLEKEKHELFLSNLERLHDDKSVNDSSYNSLKTEYSSHLKQSISKIEAIKQELNKKLRSKTKELEVYKQELANLDTRLKVGQISASIFFQQSKKPEKKASSLEDEVTHLNLLINAEHSSEIVVPQSKGLGPFFAPSRKTETKKTVFEQVQEPEPPAPAPVPAPIPVIVPEPSPLPIPPIPPTPPPPVPVEQFEQPVIPRDSTSISSLSILPNKVLPGSHVGIVAIIANYGMEDLVHRAELRINNMLESVMEVKLAAGQSDEITFMTVAGKPGDYIISVDSASGILSVVPATL